MLVCRWLPPNRNRNRKQFHRRKVHKNCIIALRRFHLLDKFINAIFSVPEEEYDEDYDNDLPQEEQEMGMLEMLQQHRQDGGEYYGYDEDDY